MNYTMKGELYTLPETPANICDQQEADRIRWLATYSQKENLYHAARALVCEYDKQRLSILGGTLILSGLLFQGRQDKSILSNTSLTKANERRNNFVQYLLTGIEEAPQEMWHDVLRYTQQWLNEDEHDASWWCGQADLRISNEELESHLQNAIQLYARVERRKRGSNGGS